MCQSACKPAWTATVGEELRRPGRVVKPRLAVREAYLSVFHLDNGAEGPLPLDSFLILMTVNYQAFCLE